MRLTEFGHGVELLRLRRKYLHGAVAAILMQVWPLRASGESRKAAVHLADSQGVTEASSS